THPSALAAERRRDRRRKLVKRGYERLEFLGDRVLGLVVADLLWRRFEDEPEGDLTRRHTHLVRREALARVAEAIELGPHLVLSRAEAAAGAAGNPGILADACEALIAAIFVDGGFAAASSFVRRFWEPLIDEMEEPPRDPKTALQEWAQARGLALPAYELVRSEEHTSELQSRSDLVCRLLLEKKKIKPVNNVLGRGSDGGSAGLRSPLSTAVLRLTSDNFHQPVMLRRGQSVALYIHTSIASDT